MFDGYHCKTSVDELSKKSELSIRILTHVLITYLLIVKFVENWLENLFAW
jgi:hypothetical protein